MKEINLEEIFENNYDHKTMVNRSVMSKEKFVEVCYDVCKQLLGLAAENAGMEEIDLYINDEGYVYKSDIAINKQSILDTINQIK